jgi:tRNA pseudouridine55 synthase
MTYLLREASGDFFLQDSLSLENLEYLISKKEYFKILTSVNKMLFHIPVVILDYDKSRRFVNGGEILINKDFENVDILRVFSISSTFLGLAERYNGSKKIWKPNKVIVI